MLATAPHGLEKVGTQYEAQYMQLLFEIMWTLRPSHASCAGQRLTWPTLDGEPVLKTGVGCCTSAMLTAKAIPPYVVGKPIHRFHFSRYEKAEDVGLYKCFGRLHL